MFKIICVTNRFLCNEPFLERLDKIAASGVDSIILREKDLTHEEYHRLAKKAMIICQKHSTHCVLHSFAHIACELGSDAIHLPLPVFKVLPYELRKNFSTIGVSVHSPDEAIEAVELGASYLTAGHIFPTDCKKGLAPRGLDFLNEICRISSVSVFAIGGITNENVRLIKSSGAAGACIMSGLMTCPDPSGFIDRSRKECKNDI